MFRLFFVVTIALSSTFVGCRGSESSPTDSSLQHSFGVTRKEPTEELSECSTSNSISRPGTSYLQNLAKHIAANNPSTFSGAYSIDKFCFSVLEIPGFNASADAGDRSVTFHAEAFTYLRNDAIAAAILAHEMAHITMQHHTSAVKNEQEADEVGFELFLRAGFQPVYFTKMFNMLSEISGGKEAAEACMAQLEKEIEPANPERNSHPDICWRAYDIAVKEMKDHKQDYAALISKATLVNLSGSRLEEVKADIKQKAADGIMQ